MYKLVAMAALLVWASVPLFAQAELRGKVTDEQGNPLPGAHVVITELGEATATDAKGRYAIEEVPPGEYRIRVSFVGYEDEWARTRVPEGVERILVNVRMTRRVFELEALVVKGTRADASAPFAFLNLEREAWEPHNLGVDVPFLLQLTPSAVITSDAGTGIGYTGMWIRGSDPTRINVTINGIPLNDAESQGVYWVDLPDFASSTATIQVQRGVGTSTNGAGAFGATINLNTLELQREPYGELSLGAGSFGTLRSTLRWGSGLIGERFLMEGRLSAIRSDGYIDRASADLRSFYFSTAYLTDRSSLRLTAFSGREITYQAWYGVPVQYLDDPELRRYNPAGTEKAGAPYDNEVDDYTQTHLQLHYSRNLHRNWNLNLALHYTRGYGFYEQYKADEDFAAYGLPPVELARIWWPIGTPADTIEQYLEAPGLSVTIGPGPGDTLLEARYRIDRTDLIRRRWLDNHFYGAIWNLYYTDNGRRLQLTWGGAWNQYLGAHFGELIWARNMSRVEKGFRYYDNDAVKTDWNTYLKLQYEPAWKWHTYLDLQLRRVDYRFEGFDLDGVPGPRREVLTFFNPKLGLTYTPNERTQLYASLAVAHREPNRNDYTESSPLSQPRPERLYDLEAGYRKEGAGYALNVNFYYMYYKDQLALTGQINDVGERTRVNIPQSYRAGVELHGGAGLGGGLRLEAALTLSRNKVRTFTEYIDNWDTGTQETVVHRNTDLAFSPSVVGYAVLSWDAWHRRARPPAKRLTCSLATKYVGKQYLDNTSNEAAAIAPYTYTDLNVRYVWQPARLGGEVVLTLALRNLFDSWYETNGWVYRYISTAYDARPDDPYARLEYGNQYNLSGYYPQAPRNLLAGISIKF